MKNRRKFSVIAVINFVLGIITFKFSYLLFRIVTGEFYEKES